MKKKEKVLCSVCGKLAGKGLSRCHEHHGEWAYGMYEKTLDERRSFEKEVELLRGELKNTAEQLCSEINRRVYCEGKIDGMKLASGIKEEIENEFSRIR